MLSVERLKELEDLEKKMGIYFSNRGLLNQSLTHSSYVNERSLKEVDDNERLEFFGDAVLKLVISKLLLESYPSFSEGELTKVRAVLVSDVTLAKFALELNLGNYILLGSNEKKTGGASRTSNLAGALEALFAAVFFDSGLAKIETLIRNLVIDKLPEYADTKKTFDYKSKLQEEVQKRGLKLPTYKVIKEIGPDHEKVFHSEVKIRKGFRSLKTVGIGRTKKEAEQIAAKEAMENLFSFIPE
jgi:ribonuclease-3